MRRPYHKLVPPPIKRSKILVSGGVLKMRVDQASALAWVAVAIAYWCIPSIKGMSGGKMEMQGFHNRKIQLGVAIVMSVKLYLWLLNVWLRCLWLRVLRLGTLPENPFFPTSSDRGKKWPPCGQLTMLLSDELANFPLPVFTSNFPFLLNCFTVCLERTQFLASASKGHPLLLQNC